MTSEKNEEVEVVLPLNREQRRKKARSDKKLAKKYAKKIGRVIRNES